MPFCRLLVAALVVALLPSTAGTVGGGVGAPAHAQQTERKEKQRRIPHITEATYRRLSEAQELMDAEQYAEAIAVLEPLVARERRYNGNERAQMHNMLGYANYELDNIERTIYHYEQVLAQMPDISEGMELTTLNQLSKLYYQGNASASFSNFWPSWK